MASWTRQALATRIAKLCGTQAPAGTGKHAWLADAKTVSAKPVGRHRATKAGAGQ